LTAGCSLFKKLEVHGETGIPIKGNASVIRVTYSLLIDEWLEAFSLRASARMPD